MCFGLSCCTRWSVAAYAFIGDVMSQAGCDYWQRQRAGDQYMPGVLEAVVRDLQQLVRCRET